MKHQHHPLTTFYIFYTYFNIIKKNVVFLALDIYVIIVTYAQSLFYYVWHFFYWFVVYVRFNAIILNNVIVFVKS